LDEPAFGYQQAAKALAATTPPKKMHDRRVISQQDRQSTAMCYVKQSIGHYKSM
jgi:hypothetical protein